MTYQQQQAYKSYGISDEFNLSLIYQLLIKNIDSGNTIKVMQVIDLLSESLISPSYDNILYQAYQLIREFLASNQPDKAKEVIKSLLT